MNRIEAAQVLPSEEERRFLIRGGAPLLIVNRPVTSQPDHLKIAQDLVSSGILHGLVGVFGGYCISINGRLTFWGPAVGDIEHATKTQFDQTVDSFGAIIIP